MRKEKQKKTLFIALILLISIGFAYLSAQLNIIGNTFLTANTWDIYFENIQVKNGSVTSPLPTISNKTTVNYTVALNQPGDFYEFTVDARNNGTIDAMIDSINMTEISNRTYEFLDYTVTYADDSEIEVNDTLEAQSSTTYKIHVGYKKDIVPSNLPEENLDSLNLAFTVNFIQADETSTYTFKLPTNTATLDNNINFKQISSNENGNGLYLRNGTQNDRYPIYYYRGAVTNNNVKFADFCWKIVRTTETGGIKLIYNGKPDSNGNCTNTTGEATQVGTSQFNSAHTSPAYSGYMYGEVYNRNSEELSNEYLYGSKFNFVDVDSEVSGDGTYTLTTTTSDYSNLNDYHYTCFNSTGECSEIKYIYYKDGTTAYYITIKDGKSVADALSEMMENKTDSKIKTYIDNWFEFKFEPYFKEKDIDYDDYLEDTVWCSDRSFRNDTSGSSFEKSGWNPRGGSTGTYLNYGALSRRDTTGVPTMDCKYKKDSFTVEDRELGNGLLTYPVGLLTADEIMLAGGWAANNTSYYLYTNTPWWSLSPGYFDSNGAYVFRVNSDGRLNGDGVAYSFGVRPSVSLKHGIKVLKGGDGTATNPYTFITG